jgi:hypothetical protein
MNHAAEVALVHSMGQKGFKYLSTAGTATYAGSNMITIHAITASTITCVSVRGDSLTAVPVLAGTIINGEFSSVTIAGVGGEAIAYLA